MTVSKLCAKAASEDRTLMFAAIAWALIAAVPNAQAAGLDTASGHKTVAGKVTGAIESPLRDVNLMKTEIPAVLQDARRAPYAPVAGASCQRLKATWLLDRVGISPPTSHECSVPFTRPARSWLFCGSSTGRAGSAALHRD